MALRKLLSKTVIVVRRSPCLLPRDSEHGGQRLADYAAASDRQAENLSSARGLARTQIGRAAGLRPCNHQITCNRVTKMEVKNDEMMPSVSATAKPPIGPEPRLSKIKPASKWVAL